MPNNDIKLPLKNLKTTLLPESLVTGCGYEHNEVAIPQLAGNPLYLLNALIKLSVISIPEADHGQFHLLGSDDIDTLSKDDIEDLERVINRIQLTKQSPLRSLILLGNSFSNREYNEYVMLILLQRLKELGLKIHLVMDIKDYIFLHLLEDLSTQADWAIEEIRDAFEKKSAHSELEPSAVKLIKGILQNKISITKLASLYHSLKPHCQLLHASKKQNGNVIVYSAHRFVSTSLGVLGQYFPELKLLPLDLQSPDALLAYVKALQAITSQTLIADLFQNLQKEMTEILANSNHSEIKNKGILTQLAMGLAKLPAPEARFHFVYNEEKFSMPLPAQCHPLIQRERNELKVYLCYADERPGSVLDHSNNKADTALTPQNHSPQISAPALIKESTRLTTPPIQRSTVKPKAGEIEYYFLGDLHGNMLKLLHCLYREGLISLPRKNYLYFAHLYLHCQEGDIKKNFLDFKKNLQTITPLRPVNDYFIYLIGDIFTDRGRADPYTLSLLTHLSNRGVNFKIIASNHDTELLHQHHQARNAEKMLGKLSGEMLKACYGNSYFLMPEQSCSGKLTASLLENGALSQEEMVCFFDQIYYPRLELFDVIPTQSGLIIVVHAPAGLPLFEGLALQMNMPFITENRASLLASLEGIRDRCRRLLQADTIHLFFEQLIGKNAQNPSPHNEPFTYAIWNRSEKDIHFNNRPKDTSITVIHGHNGEGRYPHLPLLSVDSEFGKNPTQDDAIQHDYLIARFSGEMKVLAAAASSSSLTSAASLERSFSSVFSEEAQSSTSSPTFFSQLKQTQTHRSEESIVTNSRKQTHSPFSPT